MIPLKKLNTQIVDFSQTNEKKFIDKTSFQKKEQEYSLAIGNVIFSFAYLEDIVDASIAEIINDSDEEFGYRVIKYLSFRDKVSLWKDLYSGVIKEFPEDMGAPLLSEFDHLFQIFIKLSEFRNVVAHANWSTIDEKGFVTCRVIESKYDGGLRFERKSMTTQILSDVASENYSICEKLQVFKEKVESLQNSLELVAFK
jgi:hypothetical protein